MKNSFWAIACITLACSIDGFELQAQIGGSGSGLNPSGSLGAGGSRLGAAATRGLRGPTVNPNFSPRGSLSTYGRFHPNGSIGTALNLNPEGSVFWPNTESALSGIGSALNSPVRYRTNRPIPSPTRRQLELMPRRSVRSWARVSAGQFAMELDRFGNGDDWKSFLHLDELQKLLPTDTDAGLTAQDRGRLQNIAERYEKLASKTEYRHVWQLRGFRTLLTSMQQLVADDNRDRLIRSGLALNRALDAISKDTDWKAFLAISDDAALMEEVAGDSSATADIDQLKAVLDRFEKIQSDPQYDLITQLPEFQATRENLVAFMRQRE